jgi:hypothetical protein
MGGTARDRGDLEQARRLHLEALGIHRELVRFRVPNTLGHLGCAEARLGALDDAEAHLRQAAALLAGRPQPATQALVLVGFAWAALGAGRRRAPRGGAGPAGGTVAARRARLPGGHRHRARPAPGPGAAGRVAGQPVDGKTVA